MTAGGDKVYPIDYSHLNILGFARGAKAIDEANPDKAIFPVVDTTAVYGHMNPSPHEDAGLHRRSGLHGHRPQVLGSVRRRGRRSPASRWWWARTSAVSTRRPSSIPTAGSSARPEMERRVRIYKRMARRIRRHHRAAERRGHRLGVAEYVVEKLGVETIELKWGQGAKCIGGEIKIRDLDRAIELQKRGLHRHSQSRRARRPDGVPGRRHQGVRAALPPGLHRRGAAS